MATKTHFPKAGWFAILFVIGCLLGLTQLFAPLHELAHVTTAQNHGVRAQITGWAETSMERLDRPAILSGWIAEVITLSILALVVALVGIKSPWATGGFWYGAAIVHWLRALGSTDFNSTMAQSLAEDGKAYAFSRYSDTLRTTWIWGGIIVLGSIGIIIYFCTRKRKSPKVFPGA